MAQIKHDLEGEIIKNYDEWNELKKVIDKKDEITDLYFYEREVWWCSVGLNVGVEVDGKHELFERPVLVLKVFNSEMIWCLPITSTIKKSRFYYKIKFRDEFRSINIGQIKTISSKRLLRKVDQIDEKDFTTIKELVIDIIKSETPHNLRGISEAEAVNEISIAN